MTIAYVLRGTLDKEPTSTVWAPGPDGWKCFKGPKHVYYVIFAEGTLEDICKELQELRDSCPQGPADGWHTAYTLTTVTEGPKAGDSVRHTPNGLLVMLRMCVTNDENPIGSGNIEPLSVGQPLTSFGSAIRGEIEWYLAHHKKT